MKRKFRIHFILLSCLLMYGCASTYAPPKGAAPDFFVGVFSTHDPEILDVSRFLTGWNTAKINGRIQVFLRVTDEGFRYGDTADWAVMVRGDETLMVPGSSVDVADGTVSIRIYRRHRVDTTKCCANTLPYEEFDIAEASYLGTKGRINFSSKRRASFSVTFREEKVVNGRELIGKPVRVTGCWNIKGENQQSGCRLGES